MQLMSIVNHLDEVLSVNLPLEEENQQLFKLVTTYQVHLHSKTCRKCKTFHKSIRFHYNHTLKDRVIVSKTNNKSSRILTFYFSSKKTTLKKVSDNSNHNLDVSKMNSMEIFHANKSGVA